jgi:hypothetical protein
MNSARVPLGIAAAWASVLASGPFARREVPTPEDGDGGHVARADNFERKDEVAA